jgi:hypothetical protein
VWGQSMQKDSAGDRASGRIMRVYGDRACMWGQSMTKVAGNERGQRMRWIDCTCPHFWPTDCLSPADILCPYSSCCRGDSESEHMFLLTDCGEFAFFRILCPHSSADWGQSRRSVELVCPHGGVCPFVGGRDRAWKVAILLRKELVFCAFSAIRDRACSGLCGVCPSGGVCPSARGRYALSPFRACGGWGLRW